MIAKRKIEVFSAGCSLCQETIEMVTRNACQACEVIILDMNDTNVADRAKALGIGSVPAVVIDGKPVYRDSVCRIEVLAALF